MRTIGRLGGGEIYKLMVSELPSCSYWIIYILTRMILKKVSGDINGGFRGNWAWKLSFLDALAVIADNIDDIIHWSLVNTESRQWTIKHSVLLRFYTKCWNPYERKEFK